MILRKLYTEPYSIFEPVVFHNGLNFIFGKKESQNPKDSLNSIGKSTFLDLIDFCLLSSFTRTHNPRIYNSTKLIDDLTIVLEFEVNNELYIIKRSFENSNFINFGTLNDSTTYSIKELKIKLSNLIFKQEDYIGVFNSSWYRSLMAFFLKIQKFKKEQFTDPIKYIKEISEEEINQYHLFLLNIDNTISHNIFKLRTDQKRLKPSIEEVKKFVEEKYGLKNIKETQNEINKLRLEIRKLQSAIATFKLGEQYENAEDEANKLTEKIKEFLYQNYLDKERIQSYQESFLIPEKISLRRITSIYKEISEDFALQVNETLNAAIDFRKNLSESRKEFISEEITQLESFIDERKTSINELEDKRAKLFYFLSAKEAISDLTEAFYNISEKQNNLNELEGNSKILIDLSSELTQIESEIGVIFIELTKFIEDIKDQITDIYEIITEVFDEIYIDRKDTSSFSLTPNFRKNSLLEIDLSMPDMFGKGKNQGRTLIYDLSILLLNIKENRNMPKFIIHDGIFDGVDKAHFIAVCEFIESLVEKGVEIQYITTINEEGTLTEKFGNTDLVTPKMIEEKSILILTPNNKLLKGNF